MRYKDREQAGQILAQEFLNTGEKADLVLGAARGGLVIAFQISDLLKLPLDVIVPRKIGAPMQPELAIGAISIWGDAILIDDNIARYTGATPEYIEREIQLQKQESRRRLIIYRGSIEPPDFTNKYVILADDGIATGYTIQAAAEGLKKMGASKITIAAPVGAPDSVSRLKHCADEVICPLRPENFFSVGSWYDYFPQTTDDEVVELLKRQSDRF